MGSYSMYLDDVDTTNWYKEAIEILNSHGVEFEEDSCFEFRQINYVHTKDKKLEFRRSDHYNYLPEYYYLGEFEGEKEEIEKIAKIFMDSGWRASFVHGKVQISKYPK